MYMTMYFHEPLNPGTQIVLLYMTLGLDLTLLWPVVPTPTYVTLVGDVDKLKTFAAKFSNRIPQVKP